MKELYNKIEEESKEQIILSKDYKILFRLFRYIFRYKWGVVSSVLLLLVISGFELAEPYITKVGIDRGIMKNNVRELTLLSILYLLLMLGNGVLTYIQRFAINKIGQNIMHDIAVELFTHFQRLSLSFFNRHPVGQLVTRLTNDIQSLQELFTSGLAAVFSDMFILAAIVVVMFLLNVKLTIAAVIALPFIFGGSIFFRSAMRKSYDQIRVKIAKVNAFLNENITGMKIVQIFNAQCDSMNQFRDLSTEYMNSWLTTVYYMSIFFPFVSLMGGVMTALVLWYGGGQVVRGMLTFGSLVAFLQYVTRLIQPINKLSERYNVFLAAIAAAQKVFTMMDSKEMITEPENPIHISELKDKVEFKNVSFGYHPAENVLKNVSFTINKNERVAIVGATGAGKSTIINLLYRFYDVSEGEIIIDGHNIKKCDIKELRRNFGLVHQDVFLFSGTVFDNIRLGDPSITFEQVKAAAELVNADKFIEKLPQKYNTLLGERGTGLSTGEKQLLSFARTVALNPKIMLVLDEATSNIDSETERLIQQGLDHLLEKRTALIIAHRLSTIKKADKIIVLHKGEIREIGTQQELLEKKGLYYNLYQLQFNLLVE